MIDALIRLRHVTLVAVVALMAGLIAAGRHVQYEQSIQSFFAQDDPDVVRYKEASRAFGNDQFVFVGYEDPKLLSEAGMGRLSALAKALGPAAIEGVVRVESLDQMPVLWSLDDTLIKIEKGPAFLRNGAIYAAKRGVGAIPRIGPAVSRAGPREIEELRRRMVRHPLFEGTVIDATGTFTALVVRLKAPEDHDVKATIASIRAIADAFASGRGLRRPVVVGPPALLADGFAAIEIDGKRLSRVGMLLIGLVTLTATRSLWWAIVPILAGWLVWLATETALSVLGLRLSLSGGPLVAQIIVLTMPAASHLALHFRDARRQVGDAARAARETLGEVTRPILWCAATGAIGYAALLTSNVVPIRQFGAVLAACSALAALVTLALSPIAMRPPFPMEIPDRSRPPGAPSSSWMNRLTGAVVRRPLPIVLGTLAAVVPVTLGMTRLVYESNYINAFKPDSRVVSDYHAIEARLGGIGVVYLVVPADRLDGATLDRLDALGAGLRELKGADGLPAVGHLVSPSTVLDPDGTIATLTPELRDRALATKLELIAASPQADLMRGFYNPSEKLARVLVRLSEQQPADAKERVFGRALSIATADFGPRSYLTGLSHLLTRTARGVMATQWTTILWSTGGILVMLTLAFRGPVLAVLAIVPTLLSVGLALGLMGWLGIKLDLASALVASVALGLSVDDTFHCLLQYRRHRAASDSFADALAASYRVTGPGVLLSSLAVAAGFMVLRFSEFAPFSNFGTMVATATAGSSIGNLVLLPAFLALGHRRADREVPGAARQAPPAPSSADAAS